MNASTVGEYGADLAVIDVGNRKAKVAGENDVAFTATSAMAQYVSASSDEPGYLDRVRFNSDQEWYLAGEHLEELAGMSPLILFNLEERYWSEWFCRMVLYCLFRVFADFPTGKPRTPRITLSLPASIFADKVKLEKVRQALVGNHTVVAFDPSKRREVKFKFTLAADHIILRPEGAGAFALGLLAEAKGQAPTNYSKRNVAVASWGYLTLSVIAFNQGHLVKGFYKSNSDVGMQRYVQRIANQCGSPIGITDMMWEDLLFTENPTIMGRPIDGFESRVRQQARVMATNGLLFLGNSLAGMNVDTLLFTGGTALYLDTLLKGEDGHFWDNLPARSSLPLDVFLSPEAEFADAAGHYMQQTLKRETSI